MSILNIISMNEFKKSHNNHVMTINFFHKLPRYYGVKIIYYKLFPFQNKVRFVFVHIIILCFR